MLGLVTDRAQRHVYYRRELMNKGWAAMTTEERAKWLGDPLSTPGANLFTYGEYYSSTVDLKYRSEEIVATAAANGTYLYAVSIIGKATDYENEILTLSADAIEASGVGTPQLSLYWHDDKGYDYAGASLATAGSITFNTSDHPNTHSRANLAVYVYATTYQSIAVGDYAKFTRVMLEFGNVRHPYVPFVEIVPTDATKGAYNYSDLNRVERAVAEISDILGLGLVTKTDWKMWDIPKSSDMSRYLQNIETLRGYLPEGTNAPSVPTMDNLTYVGANQIEIILNSVYSAVIHKEA